MADTSSRDLPEPRGLTSAEAASRLARFGPNAPRRERPHPWLTLARKFWAPVPWMLEATILLEVLLGRHGEGALIATLLVFNAVIGLLQERRAGNALKLLEQRLQVQARVHRDGRWQAVNAEGLVPGDVIHLRAGDIVPADLKITSGQVLLDQSTLTGEALPVEGLPAGCAYAGTVVRRGEATGCVSATGMRTAFGTTAELVRFAGARSQAQKVIFLIVQYLVALDLVVAAGVLTYGVVSGLPWRELLLYCLTLLIASVPIALPVTFTVATAVGAMELARAGVLVTRLAAIEEAAGMDVLCADKTGTLTQNRLAVAAVQAYPPFAEDEVLRWAALASEEATQDPIDLAILTKARAGGVQQGLPARTRFVPFDPATKRSEAEFLAMEGLTRATKGAPAAVLPLTGSDGHRAMADVERLAASGSRVLAVAVGSGEALQLAGLVALNDPPRVESAALIRTLSDLGVRVVMVTGDGAATARAVAATVGIGNDISEAEALTSPNPKALDADIFAGVLPEDKYHLVRRFQEAGHITGMTGDGVNDAPALKQAEVGVAVANAADVAKAAASLVLTNPGLEDIVAAVETSRRIHRRLLTYTLNKIIKTCEIALLLTLGLLSTGTFITTPSLIVLLLFTNDFVTMATAADRVAPSKSPSRWEVRSLVSTALALALPILLFTLVLFFAGRDWLRLPLPQLRTLVFILLVFFGQGTVYLVREDRHFWHSMPHPWLLTASLADLLVVFLMATQGLLMAPLSPLLVAATLLLVALFLGLLDYYKLWIVGRLGNSTVVPWRWCGRAIRFSEAGKVNGSRRVLL